MGGSERLLLPADTSGSFDFVFDPVARRVYVNACELRLTSMEYNVLEALTRAAGQIVSRDELMIAAFGRRSTPVDRALDVHVSHLRRKLGPLRDAILTVRSVGYVFRHAVKNS